MKNQRSSRQRQLILEAVKKRHDHPTADQIYLDVRSEDSHISRGTVYRNLARFKSQGLVNSVATVHGVERFDAMTHPHVHFICTGCDEIVDLPQMEIPESLSAEAEEVSGCRIQNCRLTFTGLCGKCANK